MSKKNNTKEAKIAEAPRRINEHLDLASKENLKWAREFVDLVLNLLGVANKRIENEKGGKQ